MMKITVEMHILSEAFSGQFIVQELKHLTACIQIFRGQIKFCCCTYVHSESIASLVQEINSNC